MASMQLGVRGLISLYTLLHSHHPYGATWTCSRNITDANLSGLGKAYNREPEVWIRLKLLRPVPSSPCPASPTSQLILCPKITLFHSHPCPLQTPAPAIFGLGPGSGTDQSMHWPNRVESNHKVLYGKGLVPAEHVFGTVPSEFFTEDF